MYQILKQNIKPFSITFVFGSVSIYSYLNYMTYKNKKKWFDAMQDPNQFDTTRDSNEFFGINWGFAADNMIKMQLDTGDLLFMKFDCNQTFGVNEFIQCYYKQFFTGEAYDDIGWTQRIDEDVYIWKTEQGQTNKIEYSEFLSQPFVKELSFRKLICQDEKTDLIILQNSNQLQPTNQYQDGKEFILDIFKKSKIVPEQVKYAEIQDFDLTKPIIFQQCKLDSKVNIRTKSNVFINDKI